MRFIWKVNPHSLLKFHALNRCLTHFTIEYRYEFPNVSFRNIFLDTLISSLRGENQLTKIDLQSLSIPYSLSNGIYLYVSIPSPKVLLFRPLFGPLFGPLYRRKMHQILEKWRHWLKDFPCIYEGSLGGPLVKKGPQKVSPLLHSRCVNGGEKAIETLCLTR